MSLFREIRVQGTNFFLVCCLLLGAHAGAQTDLLGKLVEGDDQSRTGIDNVSVSLDEDGSHDVTKDGGLFHLHLASSLRPGVEVTITVAMPGYAIYEPPQGKLVVPLDLIHRREIQMLPKGSLKFFSDVQLRAFVEHAAKDSSRTPVPLPPQQADLSRYLRDWAVQYGFSVEQVQAEVNRWASDVESKKSNTYDLSLAAFAKKNFAEAHDRAIEAAVEEEGRLTSLQKEQQEVVDRLVRDYELAGDAAYSGREFNKASDAYKKALIPVSK
jgi:hypothetical protein